MSKYEELSKLKELLDAGVLSKEEFETKKKKILSGVGNMTPKKSKKYLVAIISVHGFNGDALHGQIPDQRVDVVSDDAGAAVVHGRTPL